MNYFYFAWRTVANTRKILFMRIMLVVLDSLLPSNFFFPEIYLLKSALLYFLHCALLTILGYLWPLCLFMTFIIYIWFLERPLKALALGQIHLEVTYVSVRILGYAEVTNNSKYLWFQITQIYFSFNNVYCGSRVGGIHHLFRISDWGSGCPPWMQLTTMPDGKKKAWVSPTGY